MDVAYTNEHGHPTQAAIEKIATWPTDGEHWQRDLLGFVQSIWWPDPGFGWRRVHHKDNETEVMLSTGGWRGNEDLIAALQAHPLFWTMCWEWSRRGGAYMFRVR
jgi:hypothetical protein